MTEVLEFGFNILIYITGFFLMILDLVGSLGDSIRAWIFAKLGWWFMLFPLGIIVVSLVLQREPYPPINPVTGAGLGIRNASYGSSVRSIPNVLYHGTPTLDAAIDIVTHNRWLARDLSPSGVWMADFNTAAGYAGSSGAIVEIHISIPPYLVTDLADVGGDSRAALEQGYRLIRNGNIHIAPTPASKGPDDYFRIEGLIPMRLLDIHGNPIPITIFEGGAHHV